MDKDTNNLWGKYQTINESTMMVKTFDDRIYQAQSLEDLEQLKQAAIQASREYDALDDDELKSVLDSIEYKMSSFKEKEPEKKSKGFFGKLFGGKEEDDDLDDTDIDLYNFTSGQDIKNRLEDYASRNFSYFMRSNLKYFYDELYDYMFDNVDTEELEEMTFTDIYKYIDQLRKRVLRSN